VVLAPDLIRGVLTARNIGREPLSLVDRWNSWGAYQWTIEGSGWLAGNPQSEWLANYYTETRLAPGEVRQARFNVTASKTPPRVSGDAWWFAAGENSNPPTLFVAGRKMILVMAGSRAEVSTSDPEFTGAVWVGLSSVRSKELASVQDLEQHLQGKPLR
jgi:hypothetical protein